MASERSLLFELEAWASQEAPGRNADKLSAAADEIKAAGGAGSVRYEPADVTNEDEVARAVAAATAWTGQLHGVVHCAGGSETIDDRGTFSNNVAIEQSFDPSVDIFGNGAADCSVASVTFADGTTWQQG